MKLTITINCDNDAFVPLPGIQASHILRYVADEVLGTSVDSMLDANGTLLYDQNGNRVGQVKVSSH
jgi:hypothetical protein